MRIMGLDFGARTTGIAMSDPGCMLASPVETVFREEEENLKKTVRRIRQLAEENDVHTIVLGLPKNMDGSEGPRAEKCRDFKALLEEESGLPVVLWDERRSSIEAHAILHANGKKEKKHRKTVDAVAASLLLEGYLGSLKR